MPNSAIVPTCSAPDHSARRASHVFVTKTIDTDGGIKGTVTVE